ncbi:HNH endonuclease [Brevibacterium sp. CS2]|nr:HNH endonuclease [Brevibacterium sp. CS2]
MTKKRAATAADLGQLLLIRRCGSCGDRRSLIDFHRDRSNPRGRGYRCKPCNAARFRAAGPERSWSFNYRRRSRDAGHLPVVERVRLRDLIERDGAGCSACGDDETNLQLDHRTPVVMGGEHSLGAVALLCLGCHREKNRSDLERVRAWRATGPVLHVVMEAV